MTLSQVRRQSTHGGGVTSGTSKVSPFNKRLSLDGGMAAAAGVGGRAILVDRFTTNNTEENVHDSIRVQPLQLASSLQGAANNTRRLHHSIVINCPELKNPVTGTTNLEDLSPLQIKRPVISPKPKTIFSAQHDINE